MTFTTIAVPTDSSAVGAFMTSFEQSLGTAGTVLGYQLFDSQGTQLSVTTNDFQGDRRAVARAVNVWNDALVKEGLSFFINTKVISNGPEVQSDWVSFQDAKAFLGL